MNSVEKHRHDRRGLVRQADRQRSGDVLRRRGRADLGKRQAQLADIATRMLLLAVAGAFARCVVTEFVQERALLCGDQQQSNEETAEQPRRLQVLAANSGGHCLSVLKVAFDYCTVYRRETTSD
ncbi:MAG TPA: hypothetical protein VMG60_20600 [Burkholderiaceae bacterium]|nr:hypothetical protein [Burkholderiaceae bacterium]